MKTIKLSEAELRTLIWAVNNQYYRSMRANAGAGKPMENEQTTRLCEISNKAYAALLRAEREKMVKITPENSWSA